MTYFVIIRFNFKVCKVIFFKLKIYFVLRYIEIVLVKLYFFNGRILNIILSFIKFFFFLEVIS